MIEQAGTEERHRWSWLTVELVLYGLILALALALRLSGLSIRVMGAREAAETWQAWRFVHGEAPEGAYSPLLLSVQALLFALLGSGDAIARIGPALVGSALVIWPFWLRSHLGRYGALAAALLLAISPTLVYSARFADGVAALTACMLGMVVLWLAYRRDRRPSYLYAIAVLIALGAISDPRAIGVTLVLVVAWGIERLALGQNLLNVDGPPAVNCKSWAVVLGATLLLVATALTFNPNGLGAWADYPRVWAQHLAPVVNGQPWYYPLIALLMYEPLLILFGAVGAVDLVARRNEARAAIWIGLGMLGLSLIAGGRGPGDVALLCAPLALLSGRAIGNLIESWSGGTQPRREGLYLGIGLAIAVYVALETAFYAFALQRNLPESQQFLWFWILAVAVGMILAGLVLAWHGSIVIWRVGGALIAIVLLLVTFSAAVGLNHVRANDARELHARIVSDEGVRDALRVLERVSFRQSGHPLSTPITVHAAVGPVWRWYLRDWEQVRIVEALTANVDTPLVLGTAVQGQPVLGERYVGQDFVVQAWWQPGRLSGNEQLWWWLYRKSRAVPEPTQKVIVWLQAE